MYSTLFFVFLNILTFSLSKYQKQKINVKNNNKKKIKPTNLQIIFYSAFLTIQIYVYTVRIDNFGPTYKTILFDFIKRNGMQSG